MRDIHRYFRCLLLASVLMCSAAFGFGQTQVNLRTQSRDVDFSQSNSTRPVKTGTVFPATCSTGDFFFKSDAPAGQNVYGCAAANSWTIEGGGGGGGGETMASQLGDFALSGGGGPAVTIGANCSASFPCNYTNNNVLALSLTAPCTVTISGTNASGTVYIYASPDGVLTIGHNSAATLTPSGNCSVATGITAFPDGSKPIAAPTFTSNVWAAVTSAFDMRGLLGGNTIAPGTGIATVVNGATGVKTVSTDASIIPQYTTGSGAPSGNCTPGRDFYTDTANGNLWWCKGTNAWAQANGGGGVSNPMSRIANVHAQSAASLNGVSAGTFTTITGSSTTITANSMGANGCVRITLDFVQNGGTTTKDYDLNFGGNRANFFYHGNGARPDGERLLIHAMICNQGATNAQSVSVDNWYVPAVGNNGYVFATTALDTTSNQTLSFDVAPESGTGTSSDSITLKNWTVELIP